MKIACCVLVWWPNATRPSAGGPTCDTQQWPGGPRCGNLLGWSISRSGCLSEFCPCRSWWKGLGPKDLVSSTYSGPSLGLGRTVYIVTLFAMVFSIPCMSRRVSTVFVGLGSPRRLVRSFSQSSTTTWSTPPGTQTFPAWRRALSAAAVLSDLAKTLKSSVTGKAGQCLMCLSSWLLMNGNTGIVSGLSPTLALVAVNATLVVCCLWQLV